MAWVLLADDRVVEAPSSGRIALLRLGDEVPAIDLYGVNGAPDRRPGILIGHGAPISSIPGQDLDAFPPNRLELDELIRNARGLGNRLTRGPAFDDHFSRHRNLLETATKTTYPISPDGENAFLIDLGRLISENELQPIGIATVKKGEPMVFVYSGSIGTSSLTAVVRPSGEWNTLLASGSGLYLGLQFQMRFDRRFPFPFMHVRSKGGFERKWR